MDNFELKPFLVLNSNVNFRNICLISALWIFIVILVNPLGDFPLNDDWAYGWTVKTLLETGHFELSDWTATNLLPQVLWGSLFCLPLGFSFTALRLSTLTLGLIGIITTYGLLREVNASPKISLLGALIVCFNPLYFVLSNSFMSDIPSFVFIVLSLYFLIRGIRNNSRLAIFLGLVFSFISILNRQFGLIILPAFSFTYLIKKGFKIRTTFEAMVPNIFGIAIYVSYPSWLYLKGRVPVVYNIQGNKLLESFSRNFIEIVSTYSKNLLIISVYLGLFLFPFLTLLSFRQYKNFSTRQKKISLLFTFFIVVVVSLYFLAQRQRMPMAGNVLLSFALGPISVGGYYSFLSSTSISLIGRFWWMMTLVGVIGSALLFQCLFLAIFKVFNQKTDLNQKMLITFTASIILLYFLPISALQGYWFDRYLILFLPLLMMLFLILPIKGSKKEISSWVVSISLIIFLFYGGFTVSATHDYLSWNRVRWQALNNLIQESKVTPEQINGGFEFNGWYFGNRLEKCNPGYNKNTQKTRVNWYDFTCLWGKGNYKYTVSFVPKTGYEVEKQYPFRRWLPWREETLFVLRKII